MAVGLVRGSGFPGISMTSQFNGLGRSLTVKRHVDGLARWKLCVFKVGGEIGCVMVCSC